MFQTLETPPAAPRPSRSGGSHPVAKRAGVLVLGRKPTPRPGRWVMGLFAALSLAGAAGGEPVTLVIGIGATRERRAEPPVSEPGVVQPSPWAMLRCPPARTAAEEAFRELVPATAEAGSLYAHPPAWEGITAPFGVGVLLTDAVSDNRYIPSTRVLGVQCRLLRARASPADDVVVFLSGMGAADGRRSWVFDRLGERFAVERVLDGWAPAAGGARRVFLFRIHAPTCRGAPTTLWISDPGSLERLRRWVAEADARARSGRPPEPPGDLLPGLSHAVAAAAPMRLERLQRGLEEARALESGRWTADLTDGLERREHVVRAAVQRRVEPVYRVETVRKPGPLFTILEEEVKTQIGARTVIVEEPLENRLQQARLGPAAVSAVVERVAADADRGFEEVVKSRGIGYTVSFDATTGQLTIRYLD